MKVIFEKLLNDLSTKKVISEKEKTDLLVEFEKQLKERDEATYAKALDTVDEEHSKLFEDAMKKVDAKHTKMLKNYAESTDIKHARKLRSFARRMDETISKKLVQVVNKLKSKNINESLTNKISDYFDTYLKEVTPEKTAVDQVKLIKLEAMVKRIKDAVMINEDYIQGEIKEAIDDAKKQLAEKDKALSKIMLEKVTMVKEANLLEAKKLLDNKCKDMTPKMKAYIETFFKDADKKEIEERLDEAVKAFKEEESKLRSKLVAEADQKKKITNPKQTEEPVINEETKIANSDDAMMDHWAGIVSKSVKNKNGWRK